MTEPNEDLDLPEHFSEEARDLVAGVLDDLDDEGGDPDALLWAALMQAAELITQADALDEQAREADYVSVGSTGQEIIHPGVQAARTARVEAGKIILGLRGKVETRNRFAPGAGGSASRAAAARWGQRRGGRSVRGA